MTRISRLLRPIMVTLLVLAVQPAFAHPAPDGFADLAARLLPGVVNIASTQTIKAGNEEETPDLPFPPGSPMEKFFRDFMDRNHQGGGGGNGGEPNEGRKSQSLGSGFIIDGTGYIVTNNHVIEGADEINVILQDNTTIKAKLIGTDPRVDVALLKVETDHPLTPVPWGDSDKSRVGDWVIAIGNPFGLGGSVTAGIVSARGRDIRQGAYDDFIQTDAAINQGNSGGPLFNMDGEVIGINTAIYSRSGGSIGLGFSIPANQAKLVIAQLRQFGHPRRGYIGVKIQPVSQDIADSVGLKEPTGAMIAAMDDSGPAAKAKLQGGDVVLKFNGVPIKEMRNLPRTVAETEIGKTVPVVVWRDGKEVSLDITVGEMPDDAKVATNDNKPADAKKPSSKPVDVAALGLKIAPVTDDLRTKFQLPDGQKGVVIVDVAPKSSATEKGLKPGDVIVEVQQEEVTTPTAMADRVDRFRKSGRKSVLLLVQTGDGMRYIALPLTAAAKGQGG